MLREQSASDVKSHGGYAMQKARITHSALCDAAALPAEIVPCSHLMQLNQSGERDGSCTLTDG